jgi:hypothetical protein
MIGLNNMFYFAKFGSSDWPASPDVLTDTPTNTNFDNNHVKRQLFGVTNKQTKKTNERTLGIIVIYFCIPHYDANNYVASDFYIWRNCLRTFVLWI